MNKPYFTRNTLYVAIALLSSQATLAANFNFTAVGSVPTTVTAGETVSAHFTLTNLTNTPRNGYSIIGLPATVTQNTTPPNCTNPVNLAANASCNLQFDITGAVSASFALCKGNSCTTLGTPLNVTVGGSNTPALLNRAYITQAQGSPVQLCSVDPTTGLLSSCQSAGGGPAIASVSPQGIVISADRTTAYLTGGNLSSQTYQCPIMADTGLFGTCTPSTITSPTNYTAFQGFLTLNSGNTQAYLVDRDNTGGPSNGRVLSCPVSNNIIQPGCTDTGTGTSVNTGAVGIAFNSTNTVAYIGNGGPVSGVTTCAVSGSTFSACGVKTGAGSITFLVPTGVVLNQTGTRVYITDHANGDVYACDTTSTTSLPTFSSCAVAGTLIGSYGIAINSTNTYAYVTDNNNKVYVCPIAVDGTFEPCTTDATFTQPVDIALI